MHRAEFEVEFGIPAAPPCSAVIGPPSAHYSLYYFSWRARGKGKASETWCHAPPIRQKHLCSKENVVYRSLSKKEFKFQKVFLSLRSFTLLRTVLKSFLTHKKNPNLNDFLSYMLSIFLHNILTAHKKVYTT